MFLKLKSLKENSVFNQVRSERSPRKGDLSFLKRFKVLVFKHRIRHTFIEYVI